MSTSLQEDFNYANTVLKSKYDYKHRIVYANTNEFMLNIFNNLDISNKNVLAVMSSGDYLIMSHLFGAKTVECFDINPITYRYFFLRKWLMKNGIMNYGRCKYDELCKIINSVSTFSSEYEKESNDFWKEIVKKLDRYNYHYNGLITSSVCPLEDYYQDRKEEIEKLIASLNPVFYNANLSEKSGLGINKKYDYIFISNILDVRFNRYPEYLESIKKNLLEVLETDGSVVCTHFPGLFEEYYPDTIKKEREVFDKDFDFQMVDDSAINYRNIAYMYTRKN